MSEKYNIEELIIRFLQQDINEDELRYLKSWLEEDVEHKSYFFELKGISDSSRRSFFSKEGLNETSWQRRSSIRPVSMGKTGRFTWMAKLISR